LNSIFFFLFSPFPPLDSLFAMGFRAIIPLNRVYGFILTEVIMVCIGAGGGGGGYCGKKNGGF